MDFSMCILGQQRQDIEKRFSVSYNGDENEAYLIKKAWHFYPLPNSPFLPNFLKIMFYHFY